MRARKRLGKSKRVSWVFVCGCGCGCRGWLCVHRSWNRVRAFANVPRFRYHSPRPGETYTRRQNNGPWGCEIWPVWVRNGHVRDRQSKSELSLSHCGTAFASELVYAPRPPSQITSRSPLRNVNLRLVLCSAQYVCTSKGAGWSAFAHPLIRPNDNLTAPRRIRLCAPILYPFSAQTCPLGGTTTRHRDYTRKRLSLRRGQFALFLLLYMDTMHNKRNFHKKYLELPTIKFPFYAPT